MTRPQRVQLSRRKGWRKPENTVVVARPSRWGNPWIILLPGGRALAVQRFREMFTTDREAHEAFRYPNVEDIQAELAGKNLACWCPLDQPCHADVLLELANPQHLCPECKAGKHGNCDGTAWDDDADTLTTCTCTHEASG
ncbi:DUF4326 domain-containing protein [Microbacterium sp. KNMS]